MHGFSSRPIGKVRLDCDNVSQQSDDCKIADYCDWHGICEIASQASQSKLILAHCRFRPRRHCCVSSAFRVSRRRGILSLLMPVMVDFLLLRGWLQWRGFGLMMPCAICIIYAGLTILRIGYWSKDRMNTPLTGCHNLPSQDEDQGKAVDIDLERLRKRQPSLPKL